MSSTSTLLISAAAFVNYATAIIYMNTSENFRKILEILPEQLKVFGLFKYLTYITLLIQTLSASLHMMAHFWKGLRGMRDFVFTVYALPLGCIVVSSFWGVWFLVSPDSIVPPQIQRLTPNWLNQITHTVCLPVNLLLLLLSPHKFYRAGLFILLPSTVLYCCFLEYAKAVSGHSVYIFLDQMSQIQRLLYYAFSVFLVCLMYKGGELLSSVFHPQALELADAERHEKRK